MNAIILKALSLFPAVSKAFAILKWLLAESGYWAKVEKYLAAENQWYFELAAVAWGALYASDPNALKPVLLAGATKQQIHHAEREADRRLRELRRRGH